MSKKALAILLAVFMVLSVFVAAFAADGDDSTEGGNDTGTTTDIAAPTGDTDTTGATDPAGDDDDTTAPTGTTTQEEKPDYDYKTDARLTASSDYNGGEYVFGGKAPAMYQINTGKVFTIKEADEEGLKDEMGTTLGTYLIESIRVEAYYAIKCPSCGKANGNDTLSHLYAAFDGKCAHCGKWLPDPFTITVYRFIIVPEDSAHYDRFSGLNFVKRTNKFEPFTSTAGQYGDGKDLPQSFLEYEELPPADENSQPVTVLSNFKTSGLQTEDFGSLFWTFLSKYEYRQEQHVNNEFTIKLYDAMAKVTVAIIEGLGKAFTFIPTLIF